MRAANDDHLRSFDVAGRATGTNPCDASGIRQASAAEQNLRLVFNRLTLSDPEEAPGSEWDRALMQLVSSLNLTLMRVPAGRSAKLRQRAKWPWASRRTPEAPVFAPWILHSSLAFQDTRATREMFPARWVASYLWDPCPPAGRATDVMLISPHPSACRLDEESCVPLPGTRLLLDMIGAANAEGRCRIAVIGHARSRNATMRQLLSAKPMLPNSRLDFEVIGIEEALARLVGNPHSWDAIIVLPELRSLVVALLAKLCGIDGAWPMIWHRRGLALVCGETAGETIPSGRFDAALLVQGLALVARDAGLDFAARRLSEGWAKLRDRGISTPTRGSRSPYGSQLSDASLVELLCKEFGAHSRPVANWKAVTAPGPQREIGDAVPGHVQLELVPGR